MKKEKTPQQRTLRRKAVRKLSEVLVDVLDAFGWHGISEGEVEAADTVHSHPPSVDESARTEEPLTEGLANGAGVGAAETCADENTEEPGDDDYDDYEDNDTDPYDTDPWEVRTAVDKGISSLMNAELIPELKGLEGAPSLSTIFEALFGEEHEMTKQAEYFEELIAGYEDRVSMDDLKEAYEVLSEIVQKLKRKAK